MSSTLSSITTGASTLFNTGLNYAGQGLVCLKGIALSSGHYFVAYVNAPASGLIGGVVAKANALGSPLLGPTAAVLTTAVLAYTANRLFNHKTDATETNPYAKYLIKVAAIALAVFAGCAAAATVTAAATLLPFAVHAYVAYAFGSVVTAASLLLPVALPKGNGPEGTEDGKKEIPAPAETEKKEAAAV